MTNIKIKQLEDEIVELKNALDEMSKWRAGYYRNWQNEILRTKALEAEIAKMKGQLR